MNKQIVKRAITPVGLTEEDKIRYVKLTGKQPMSPTNNKQPEPLVNKKQPQVANFTGIKEYVIKQKYKLLNYCKGGAFGDVFFACHVDKGYEVAVKFVNFYSFINIILE